MKHIETNFLIYDLAKQGNKNKFYSAFKFSFGLIVLNCLFIILYLLNVELRADLQNVLSISLFSIFYIQMLVYITGVILGVCLLYKQAIPGQTTRLNYKVLSFLFYLLWASLFVALSFIAYKSYLTGVVIMPDYNCINRALLGMLFPLITTIYFVKKGFVIEQKKAVLTAVFTSYSFASFINLLVCPEDNAMHILISHFSVLFLVTVLLFAIIKLTSLIK